MNYCHVQVKLKKTSKKLCQKQTEMFCMSKNLQTGMY